MTEKIISQDNVGKVFGRLTILREFMGPNGVNLTRHWEYRCECGNVSSTRVGFIRNGKTRSCGCFNPSHRHKMANTTEYHIWENIIQRCTNPKGSGYKYYGGRGIQVCERWRDFTCFFEDMGPRPSPDHTVERKSTNGNYEPDNCIWATYHVQGRNRRDNIVITFADKTQCVADWATELRIPPNTLRTRLKRWPLDKALTLPVLTRGVRLKHLLRE